MDIQLKGTRYDPTPDITAFATRKVEKMRKYLGGKDDATRVYVELEKAVGGQQAGDIWRAELNLSYAGASFRSSATKDSLEKAITGAVNDMERELRRAKQKQTARERKGGGMVKSFLRGFRK